MNGKNTEDTLTTVRSTSAWIFPRILSFMELDLTTFNSIHQETWLQPDWPIKETKQRMLGIK